MPGRVDPGRGAETGCEGGLTVWELVAAALRSAAPARLESWTDIETPEESLEDLEDAEDKT